MSAMFNCHFQCPRCAKTADIITSVERPNLACHWCLRDDNRIVEMKLITRVEVKHAQEE